MEKRAWWKTAAVFALLAAVMGALQWNWFAMPLERDEGEYAYAAWLMRTGKGVPYRDSFLQKPPMIVYTYALVEALAPGSDKAGFRIAGFLAALAAAGLAWRLGTGEFGGLAGVWAAWLWVAFLQQWSMFNSVAANVEKFMVVPMLGAMLLAGNGERRWWRWGLAGMLAVVAVLFKPICVPVLGGYFLLAGQWRQKGDWRRTLACWGWAVAGGALAAAAGLAWFAWKGAMGALWECAVEYTGAYAGLANPFRDAWAWAKTFATWKLGLIMALGVAGMALRWRNGWRWLAVFAVAAVVAMTDMNGHYYLMVLPLAGIGAGAGIDWLADRSGRGNGNRWRGAVATAAVFCVLLTGKEGAALACSPERLSTVLYRGNPFVEAVEAGRIVSKLCGEDGTVHIMGSEAEILWYARRKCATRFVIAYPMTLPTRYAESYQAEAMGKLRKAAPAVVVCVRTWMGFLGPPAVSAGYFRDTAEMILGGGYRLECSYLGPKGGWVRGGEWGEHALAGASMGIWRRGESEELRTGWDGESGKVQGPGPQ